MLTFNDFLETGNNEKDRMDFILRAINEYKSSRIYTTAIDAELYYKGENPTINRYEKVIYDYLGKAHVDMWTANHKIASSFFTFAVDQLSGYLLGNGVTFEDNAIKDKLGNASYPFDQQVYLAAENAYIGGVSYGFWNFDHIDVFSAKEFVSLIDEENGAICAGIRFWQLASDKPLRATLYELDGYTDYIRRNGDEMTVLRPKRPYKVMIRRSDISGEEIYDAENYPTFPIVPFALNSEWKSLLCGKKNTIDALDLACSNMVNNADEGNLIYWVMSNAGGMDDLDAQKFLEHIRTMHVANVDNEGDVTPHSIEAPFAGTQATIDMLTKKLYTDFSCFDASAVSAGNQTATAINATYVPMDLQTDKFERQTTKFINAILQLAGVAGKPTYTRNKLINKQEEIQSVLLGAQYFTDDYITSKLLTILGDADEIENIQREKSAEDLRRFSVSVENSVENVENIEND